MSGFVQSGERAEMPLSERIQLLPEFMTASAADTDRREGVSDLEAASKLLSHAVRYLSSEQRLGRCTSVRANRRAITILCDCAESLTKVERREPAREALETWIADARRS